MARLFSPNYHHHCYPSDPFSRIKHPLHVTFNNIFGSTIAALHSHHSELTMMMSILMAMVLRPGKQGIRFITLLELFVLILERTYHMLSCISMMQLMP